MKTNFENGDWAGKADADDSDDADDDDDAVGGLQYEQSDPQADAFVP